MAKTSVRLHRLAVEPLQALQADLLAEFGVKATYEEIVGALVTGTTPAQAIGMLMAFNRDVASMDDDPLPTVE